MSKTNETNPIKLRVTENRVTNRSEALEAALAAHRIHDALGTVVAAGLVSPDTVDPEKLHAAMDAASDKVLQEYNKPAAEGQAVVSAADAEQQYIEAYGPAAEGLQNVVRGLYDKPPTASDFTRQEKKQFSSEGFLGVARIGRYGDTLVQEMPSPNGTPQPRVVVKTRETTKVGELRGLTHDVIYTVNELNGTKESTPLKYVMGSGEGFSNVGSYQPAGPPETTPLQPTQVAELAATIAAAPVYQLWQAR
ncbi:MAG: hypothetical protein ABWY71_01560 [Candidatus Saccharimonadales bacterium]